MKICIPISLDYLQRLDNKLNRCRDYTMCNVGQAGISDIVTIVYHFETYDIRINKRVSKNCVLFLAIDLENVK